MALEFDWKYILALVIIVAAVILLAFGKITFEQAMIMIAAGLAIIGVTIAYKSWKAKKLVV